MAKRDDLSKRDRTTVNALKTNAEKVVAEVNDMKYPEARKRKAEVLRPFLKDAKIICGAINASTGRICSNPPVDGSNRCSGHGGMSTGAITPEGKEKALSKLNPLARLTTGLYSRFAFTTEEQDFYFGMMEHYEQEANLDMANMLLLDRALRNFILNQRKEVAAAGEMLDESDSYNDYDSKFLRYMQALGFDRKFQVSQNNKQPNTVVNLNQLFDMPEK